MEVQSEEEAREKDEMLVVVSFFLLVWGGYIIYMYGHIYIHALRISLCRKFISRGLPPDKFCLKRILISQRTGYGLKFRNDFFLGFGGYDLQ